jgi:hypothetical protein
MNTTKTQSTGSLKRMVGPTDVDPQESEEYQRFVEESAKFCHCDAEHKPCDGVLSGGICDMKLETRRWEFCDE